VKTIPFNREVDFRRGVLEEVSPGLRRLVAPNEGPFTFKGTNTYVLGQGEVAVIDPGPDDEGHRQTLLSELARQGECITRIMLTHAHPDHSQGIPALQAETGAETLAFGRDLPDGAHAPRTPSGKELIDVGFRPDRRLRHGDCIEGGTWRVEAVHTPGHAPDHLCFALPGGIMLSGDHVMGWNTSVVAPPEGNMGDYLRSLEAMLRREEQVYFPGHGGRIDEAQRLVKAFIVHRRWREAEILDCLRDGLHTIELIVPRIYEGLASALARAAALSVYAHLEHLHEKGAVRTRGLLSPEAEFYLAE
jgi:glyoxylase-like metal-dependent hydrolase (beta-lactamase superfamily II)